MNNGNLSGKTVVITGASSGIGKATAIEFARQKANLVLVARREHSLNDLVKECEELGVKAVAIPTDVTDENAMKSVAQTAVDTFGSIDVWINDAAVTLFGRFEETPSDAYRRVIETNLFGYINGARAAIPFFRKQGRGVLINMSSIAGKISQPYTSAYSASKFAVNGLSESLRMELRDAPDIHVCTVLAPSIDTPLYQHGANYMGRAVKPMRPVYKAEKVARIIVGLAKHPRREVVVGGASRSMLLLSDLMPSFMEKMMARKVDHDHFQDKPAPAGQGNLFRPMDRWNGISGEWADSGSNTRRMRQTAFALGILGIAGAAAFGFMRMNGIKKKKIGLPGLF